MSKQSKILILMLLLLSTTSRAQVDCNPAQGTGQCGFLDANGNVVNIAIHSKFYTKSNAEGDTWLHGETT